MPAKTAPHIHRRTKVQAFLLQGGGRRVGHACSTSPTPLLFLQIQYIAQAEEPGDRVRGRARGQPSALASHCPRLLPGTRSYINICRGDWCDVRTIKSFRRGAGSKRGIRRAKVSPHCDGIPKVAGALATGTAPQLAEFHVGEFEDVNDWEVEPIADMLKRRAIICGCKKLERLEWEFLWHCGFGATSLDTQIRFLRALLPSVTALPEFMTWVPEFERCFQDTQAPYLTTLQCYLEDDVVPWTAFQAARAIQKVEIVYEELTPRGGAALRSVAEALRQGALQNLQKLQLHKCTVSGEDFRDFTEALEMSGCAKNMVSLCFIDCGIGLEAARAVADILDRDALPALRKQWFDR